MKEKDKMREKNREIELGVISFDESVGGILVGVFFVSVDG
jgi:hypothetical protein